MLRPRLALLGFALATGFAAVPAAARAEWPGPCVPGTTGPTCHFWRGKIKWVDDGDTIDVKLATSTGKRKIVRVRITGIQAMEQTVYNSHPRKRRGDCHAVEATARLEGLLEEAHGVVRLAAQDPASTTGPRLRRSVAVKIHGRWLDVGRILIAEGHALWLPNPVEYAWNVTYSTLAQQAAATHVGIWDTDYCGPGPSDPAPLRLTVHWNAKGNDFDNLNGERVRIENLEPSIPVPIGGWWLRDSALRRYTFPFWAVVPAASSIRVRVGSGTDTETTFYWGLTRPAFENPKPDGRGMGDGAYLFDTQGDLRAWMIYPCYVYCVPP